jgi:hypothetical protein
MNSCIYEGWVRHRREMPVQHALRYPLFMMYLDLDELDQVFAKRWLWSARHPAPAWFRRGDYFGDPRLTLKEAALREIEASAGMRPEGPVRVLTHLRYWGYSFNPISLYFCFAPDGQDVQAVIAEVRNTPWGERKPYVLTDNLAGENRHRRQFRFAKQLHVSPFMEMAVIYHMHLTVPGETLTVHIANETPAGKHFDATMSLKRKPIAAASLAGVLARFPWMTATVIAGIHWEALKLWWKGVPYVPRPGVTPLRETRTS